MKFRWKPAAGCGAQELILGPVLFHISINDLDNRPEYILSKLADDTKLRRGADAPESCTAIRRHLGGLEKWADRNFMMINKANAKSRTWGGTTPWTSTG